jgi:hypothetical protein
MQLGTNTRFIQSNNERTYLDNKRNSKLWTTNDLDK